MKQSQDGQIEKNYLLQEENIKNHALYKDDRLFHIHNQNCLGYKIASFPLNVLSPFFDTEKTWLTVGDYNGLEANYLQQRNQKVVASDLSDALLKEAHNEGLVKEYSKQNVEHLTYENNAFDYLICKEAFHHFPKAYYAIYEMLRVSNSAVILLQEPIDIIAKMPLLLLIKNVLDRINPLLINKIWKNRFSFEVVGNYIFKISEREIEKIAMGIGLPCVAFLGQNLFRSDKKKIEGMSDVPLNQKGWNQVKRDIAIRDFFCKLEIIPYSSLTCVMFKVPPSEKMRKEMKQLGFTIIDLPKNPYL